MSHPTPIEYATPAAIAPPANVLRRMAIVCTAIAAGVGVSILLAYVALELDWLLFVGLLWLGIGGILVFVGFVLGTTYAMQSLARRFPPPATRWRAAMAVLAPLITVPLAVGCMLGGLAWADRVATRLTIHNDSGATIDGVDVTDQSGTRSLGPLAAGRSVRTQFTSHGWLYVTLTRRSGTTSYEVDGYVSTFPGNGPREVTIDAAGVVTRRKDGDSAGPRVLSPTTLPATGLAAPGTDSVEP